MKKFLTFTILTILLIAPINNAYANSGGSEVCEVTTDPPNGPGSTPPPRNVFKNIKALGAKVVKDGKAFIKLDVTAESESTVKSTGSSTEIVKEPPVPVPGKDNMFYKFFKKCGKILAYIRNFFKGAKEAVKDGLQTVGSASCTDAGNGTSVKCVIPYTTATGNKVETWEVALVADVARAEETTATK